MTFIKEKNKRNTAASASLNDSISLATVFLIAATRPSLFILCIEHFTLG